MSPPKISDAMIPHANTAPQPIAVHATADPPISPFSQRANSRPNVQTAAAPSSVTTRAASILISVDAERTEPTYGGPVPRHHERGHEVP
jgi:hypothetical protein